jgi:hypothetical protein
MNALTDRDDDLGFHEFVVLPKTKVKGLLAAAERVQLVHDDGVLGEAFNGDDLESVDRAVAALDGLKDAAGELGKEFRFTSPFIRHRQEILRPGDSARNLRALVMNLYNGRRPLNLSSLFMNAEAAHTRIALECIVSYTEYGENDTFFMSLASEVCDIEFADNVSFVVGVAGRLQGLSS